MICVSIAEKNVEECIQALKGLACAEIRLDQMDVSLVEIDIIFSQPLKLIATCRPGIISEIQRKQMLLRAILAGAAYVDIEVDAPESYKKEIIKVAREKGVTIISSYHNYEKTPSRRELEHIVNWCFESDIDIAKIACTVSQENDNARLLGLLGNGKKIIAIGMGEMGKLTRIVGPLLGSPIIYACLSKGKETAPGQIDYRTLTQKIEELRGI